MQCFPGKHGMQLMLKALPGEKEPTGQSPLAMTSPGDEQYFPAGHDWHVCWPMNELKNPTGHAVQVAETADPFEKEPEGQSPLAEVKPEDAQNLPAGQREHDAVMPLPATEKLPGSHNPLPLGDEQPIRQYAPAGHALHSAVVPLPEVEKLPGLQGPLPLEMLQPARQYLPPGQALHDELVPLPADAKVPAAQTPLPSILAQPARQYRPPGQGLHNELVPLPAIEKVPAAQIPLPFEDEHPAKQ
jgi:hypothetical protein